MAVTKDWQAWHEPYADASSPLSRRLRLVRRHIGLWLDDRQGEALTAVSACAGQGHDLLGVLATRADAHRVRATLLDVRQVLHQLQDRPARRQQTDSELSLRQPLAVAHPWERK